LQSSQPPEKKLKEKAYDETTFKEHEFMEKLKDTPTGSLMLRRSLSMSVTFEMMNWHF
jgi:hypothetical protein